MKGFNLLIFLIKEKEPFLSTLTKKKNMKKQVILVLFFFQVTFVFSQNGAHQIIEEYIKSKNVPGIAFLIAKEGEILEEGYYGKSNIELEVNITKNSVFAIASMSKTFTAAAILLMAEQGLLSLDDSIRKYIPEAPDSWEPITIYHLLTHSSGLIDDWSLYDWNKSNELFLKTQTNDDFLKIHFEHDLKFRPGTDISYSSGPFILGIVIERITGEFYGVYLEDNIFRPLSLKETFVDHPYRIIPNRVSGYFEYDTSEIKSPVSGLGNGIIISPVAYGRGDSGIRTTTNDLLKFYNALFSSDLINDQSKKLMFQPATLDNGDFISTGAGWMNWPLGGLLVSEHSGGFRTGFSSQAFVIPCEKFVVIVLTNLKGGASFSLNQELATLYYPELEKLSKKQPKEDTKKELTYNHLKFFQNISSTNESKDIHNSFPFSYYSKSLKQAISETESITYLGERYIQNESLVLFNVNIHSLRYYRLNGKTNRFTTAYLDEDRKLVFIDYPEYE